MGTRASGEGGLDLLQAEVGDQALTAAGGQAGQDLLELADVAGDDGEQVVHLAGDALTAAFTVLITLAVTRATAPRWMTWLGYAAAALIATGVVIPLGLEAASLTNFAGYVLWCLWLLAMAAFLWRTPAAAGGPAAPVPGANPVPGRR